MDELTTFKELPIGARLNLAMGDMSAIDHAMGREPGPRAFYTPVFIKLNDHPALCNASIEGVKGPQSLCKIDPSQEVRQLSCTD